MCRAIHAFSELQQFAGAPRRRQWWGVSLWGRMISISSARRRQKGPRMGRMRGVAMTAVLAVGAAGLAPARAAHPSSNERPASAATSVQDVEGNTYLVMSVGRRLWMGENLRVTLTAAGEPLETHLPKNDAEHEAAFGRLYDWENAKRACPTGWRLPSDEDWSALEQHFGATSVSSWLDEAYWRDVPVRTGSESRSSFSARPSGYWNEEGFETRFGSVAVFWTATPAGSDLVWSRVITATDPPVRRASQHPHYGLSIRCVAGGADQGEM